MIELASHPDGLILSVRALPGARRNQLRGEQDGALKVCVTQSPEKGKATRAVLDLLCKTLRLKKSQVELVAGETSRQKRVLVRGLGREELAARLAEAVETE